MTHVLLLRDGEIVARGPIDDTLDAAALTACFGLDLVLDRRPDGRFSAWAEPVPAAGSAPAGSAR